MPTTFSYSGTGAPPVPAPALSGALARPYVVGAGRSFLGFGLLTPFRRDEKGDFAAGEEETLVLGCVAQVLGTRCSAMTASGPVEGELPWRPEFGSLLYTLVHRNMDDPVTRQLARVYAADALERWEPRFKLAGLQLQKRKSTPNGRDVDTLVLRVVGDVIRANVPGNQVVISGASVDVGVR